MRAEGGAAALAIGVALLVGAACNRQDARARGDAGGANETPASATNAGPDASALDANDDARDAIDGATHDATAREAAANAEPPCPAGMAFVAGKHCSKVERTCLKSEANGANHITLCHAFEHETRCLEPEDERAFCIDQYEYPNTPGAHPPWMVSWYDAQATCLSLGKRLCYESEWTMACEGPERLPFPYGWERDNTACNIDNPYIAPSLDKMIAVDPPDAGDAAVQAPELERLDQSVPSGAMPRCVSGYGVSDMTGNFDEWTINDQPVGPKGADTGMWASLKGGAWGHVRNACRPVTTSHSPGWTYYFVSFRCCADAKGYPAYAPPKNASPAPAVKAANDKAPLPARGKNAPGPSKSKVKPQNG